MSTRSLRLVVVVSVVLLVVVCDQTTKNAARAALAGQGVVHVIGPFFVLRYTENQGAFLGLGATLVPQIRIPLLVMFPIAILGVLATAMLRRPAPPWPFLVGLSLATGGGIGNLVDRVFRSGQVIDFMNIGFGNLRTGIFNVADLAITVGCAVFLLGAFRTPRSRKTSKR